MCVKLIYVSSELLNVKIEESKSNWISIEVQFFASCRSKILIFVANKLFDAKTEKSKTN